MLIVVRTKNSITYRDTFSRYRKELCYSQRKKMSRKYHEQLKPLDLGLNRKHGWPKIEEVEEGY